MNHEITRDISPAGSFNARILNLYRWALRAAPDPSTVPEIAEARTALVKLGLLERPTPEPTEKEIQGALCDYMVRKAPGLRTLRPVSAEEAREVLGAFGLTTGDRVRSIHDCSRCGDDHELIFVHQFSRSAREWTAWAMCPQTGEPILIRDPDLSPDDPVGTHSAHHLKASRSFFALYGGNIDDRAVTAETWRADYTSHETATEDARRDGYDWYRIFEVRSHEVERSERHPPVTRPITQADLGAAFAEKVEPWEL